MTSSEMLWTATRTLSGLCAAVVTVHAVYAWIVTDLRFDPITSFLYCAFPLLSFPVFVLVHKPRIEFGLQCLFAAGYWITLSMLSWRACSANGYCGSVVETVVTTLRTKPALALLGVVLFELIALTIDGRNAAKNKEKLAEAKRS